MYSLSKGIHHRLNRTRGIQQFLFALDVPFYDFAEDRDVVIHVIDTVQGLLPAICRTRMPLGLAFLLLIVAVNFFDSNF
ncbi:hypothetical protein FHT91_005403 [Rhizobium sp. BK347]|nr:hypothetical protein [Rhizobium sp. BK252]MBB3405295.1 hypothetical protein [Rhizobium sp. BK289]MBB3417714.1 hypothetical protein [Rhizobium sp. BK284]MBB3485593.1 hypothetical protein [Rhizobium sp. BK347]